MNIEIIKKQAILLVEENRIADSSISDAYWFPNEDEVRLVEVDSSVPISSDGQVHPYYFRPSPEDELPAPSGIAMIRQEEYRTTQLPEEWGTWDDAIKLEPNTVGTP